MAGDLLSKKGKGIHKPYPKRQISSCQPPVVVRIRDAILGFNVPQLQGDSTSDNYSALLNVPGFEGDSNSKILFSLRNCSVDCRTLRKSFAPKIRTTTGVLTFKMIQSKMKF